MWCKYVYVWLWLCDTYKSMPSGWKCEQQGPLMFGEDKIQGAWKCEGSEKTKDKARKTIEKHYKGLNVEIE